MSSIFDALMEEKPIARPYTRDRLDFSKQLTQESKPSDLRSPEFRVLRCQHGSSNMLARLESAGFLDHVLGPVVGPVAGPYTCIMHLKSLDTGK